MKQFREDGKRLFFFKTPDPKTPDIEMWCGNPKHCVFCQHCKPGLQFDGKTKINITALCDLPTLSTEGNNCLLHNLNEKHTCPAFKDVDEGQPAVVMIKKKKEEPKVPTFKISKDGVEEE